LGYIVAVASGEGTGRSATAQLLDASEVAFWDDLPIQMAALMQTVPDLPGTEIILETTANGHNDLHSLWRKAEAGESEFMPVLLPWFVDPEYRREIDADFVMDADESKLAGNDGSAPTIPRQSAHAHALGAVLARRSSVSRGGRPRFFLPAVQLRSRQMAAPWPDVRRARPPHSIN
jgi:hypothetical protein